MQNPFETLGVNEGASSRDIHNAYRELARKWHPDRFPEGPERAWAEQKMIDINRAYNDCSARAALQAPEGSSGRYNDIRQLIEAGQLSRARQLLRAMGQRDAEWNYYFGLMLFERRDYDKAVVYLSIASKLSPDNSLYGASLAAARAQLSAHNGNLLARMLSALKRRSNPA